jgi:hypothetical protein
VLLLLLLPLILLQVLGLQLPLKRRDPHYFLPTTGALMLWWLLLQHWYTHGRVVCVLYHTITAACCGSHGCAA